MKNLTLTIVSLLFCLTATAQIDYYANHDTVIGGSIVYKVTNYSGAYGIEDVNNSRTGKPMRYHNGNLVEPPFFEYRATRRGDHVAIMAQIMDEVFTNTELTALRNNDLDFFMGLIVDPAGNIVELKILFDKHPLLYSIPPAKWASIEQKMKQRIKYDVSEKGKTAQFIIGNFTYSFYY